MARRGEIKKQFLLFALIASLVANIILLYFYSYKVVPRINSLKEWVSSLTDELREYKQKPTQEPTLGPCEKTYYIGEGPKMVICIKKSDPRNEVLSKCSKVVNYNLLKDGFEGMSVNEVEKARNLFIKMCMEEIGYEY